MPFALCENVFIRNFCYNSQAGALIFCFKRLSLKPAVLHNKSLTVYENSRFIYGCPMALLWMSHGSLIDVL